MSNGYYCRKCGYDLTGINSHQCPECGGSFSLDDDRTVIAVQFVSIPFEVKIVAAAQLLFVVIFGVWIFLVPQLGDLSKYTDAFNGVCVFTFMFFVQLPILVFSLMSWHEWRGKIIPTKRRAFQTLAAFPAIGFILILLMMG